MINRKGFLSIEALTPVPMKGAIFRDTPPGSLLKTNEVATFRRGTLTSYSGRMGPGITSVKSGDKRAEDEAMFLRNVG
jgi:hypothetical protein